MENDPIEPTQLERALSWHVTRFLNTGLERERVYVNLNGYINTDPPVPIGTYVKITFERMAREYE